MLADHPEGDQFRTDWSSSSSKPPLVQRPVSCQLMVQCTEVRNHCPSDGLVSGNFAEAPNKAFPYCFKCRVDLLRKEKRRLQP